MFVRSYSLKNISIKKRDFTVKQKKKKKNCQILRIFNGEYKFLELKLIHSNTRDFAYNMAT